jgi:uncharacterized protein (TIGR00290 family)
MDLPIDPIYLPEWPSMEEYEDRMKAGLEPYTEDGIRDMGFGDIFLEDLREYREKRAKRVGMQPHFPLWGCSTDTLARDFIQEGFRAIVVCVNDGYLDRSFVGREYDEALLNDLPADVDPCGEHGEFHTFVYDAPYFTHPVPVERGATVHRTYAPSSDGSASSADTDPDHSGEDTVEETGFWYRDLTFSED